MSEERAAILSSFFGPPQHLYFSGRSSSRRRRRGVGQFSTIMADGLMIGTNTGEGAAITFAASC
jgi:hypothetical protein